MSAALKRRLPIVDALLAFVPSPALDGHARWRRVSIADVTPVRPRVRLSQVELANGWLFGGDVKVLINACANSVAV